QVPPSGECRVRALGRRITRYCQPRTVPSRVRAQERKAGAAGQSKSGVLLAGETGEHHMTIRRRVLAAFSAICAVAALVPASAAQASISGTSGQILQIAPPASAAV